MEGLGPPGGSGGRADAPSRTATLGASLDLLGAAALWGGMYVVSAATFDAIPPVTLGLLRLVVGAGVLLLVFRGRFGLRRAPRARLLLAGAILALTLVLQFVGTDLTGAAEGALLTTTTPAFVLLFAATLEGSRARPLAWLGVLIALAGVALLASRDASFGGLSGPAVVGDALLVASAATWALFSSVGRPLVAAVGAFRSIFGASLVAIVLLVPLVPFELAARSAAPGATGATALPVTLETIGAVAYLGVMATAVAWSLWYRGYAAAPPTLTAALFFAQPIVGATLGVLLLHESLGSEFVVGAALIGAGVLVIAMTGEVRAVDSPAPTGRTA
jgi:drug/metabolite transporter (DMT)-like permease